MTQSRKDISPPPGKMKMPGHDENGDLQSGMRMDDYDKIKVIGKGGFAEKVYLARKKDTGSIYAIKTMSKKFILEE